MDQKRNDEIIKQRVWAMVDALPQRDAIQSGDAATWIDEVVAAHGEMAIWHATRLNGFGGSDIGVLVRNHLGERADHQSSAHDIVQSKLMRRIPLENTCDLRRGHENEEIHAQRFWLKYGAQRDQRAYDQLKNAQGAFPWMRYSPDDVVRMPYKLMQDESTGLLRAVKTPGEYSLWLIDYKAPREVEQDAKIAFQYACQLHQGAILMAQTDSREEFALTGMMLSQFDWANWALKDDVVSWDESIGQLVIEAGNRYWDCVLRGEVPGYVRRQEMPGVEAFREKHEDDLLNYANLMALSDASAARAEELRARIMQPLDGMLLGEHKISVGMVASKPVVSISGSKRLNKDLIKEVFSERELEACQSKNATYDAEAMAAYLRANEVSLKPFKKYSLDPDKVIAMAQSKGLDPDAMFEEQLMFRVGAQVKEQMRDYIEQHYGDPVGEAVADQDSAGHTGDDTPTQEDVMSP